MEIERSTLSNDSGLQRRPEAFKAPTDAPAEAPQRKKVRAHTVHVDQLTDLEILRMHQIFVRYYADHTLEIFKRDLFGKDKVILLRDMKDRSIQGFSTLLSLQIKRPGRAGETCRGIFSGDTVLEKAYWGNSALGVEFLKQLWLEKWKSPSTPLYWFLISKGYKTYLLMANNFRTHYPRFEKPTPKKLQSMMDLFYSKRFPSDYDSNSGLIIPQGASCRLREKVADITPGLMQNPRVRFFCEKNPLWKDGYELTCVAEMTFWMPIKYVIKKLFKRASR